MSVERRCEMLSHQWDPKVTDITEQQGNATKEDVVIDTPKEENQSADSTINGKTD